MPRIVIPPQYLIKMGDSWATMLMKCYIVGWYNCGKRAQAGDWMNAVGVFLACVREVNGPLCAQFNQWLVTNQPAVSAQALAYLAAAGVVLPL